MKQTLTLKMVVNEFSDDIKKKEYYKKLDGYTNNARLLANEIMNTRHLVDRLQTQLREQFPTLTGDEITKKICEIYGVSSITNISYAYFTEKYRDILPSQIRSALSQKISKAYQTDKYDIKKGEKSIRNHKKNMSVPFDDKAIKNLKFDGETYVFTMFEIPFKLILGRDKKSSRLAFGSEKLNNEMILGRVLSGEYKLCGSSFKKDNDGTYKMMFTLEIPNKQKALDPNKICGIDMGINMAIYCGTNFSSDRLGIASRQDFIVQRQRIPIQIRNLQKNLVHNSGGRGRNKKLLKLELFKDRERNFVKNKNHNFSNAVIKFCLKYNCGTIHMEYLTGIGKDKKNSWVLRNWSYYELQSQIKYKAEREGIVVKFINPKDTSKTCSKCGNVDGDSRLSQSEYECTSCGYTENADYNASLNIAKSTNFIKINKKSSIKFDNQLVM